MSKNPVLDMWNPSNSFNSLKRELMRIDPVCFAESYLKLDGKPFKITGNGWKWMADIYRYIIAVAMNPESSKPVVMVKGRQVGATIGAAALELYMMSSGMYGVNGVPPVSVMHAFPQIELMYSFSKDKLEKMINDSAPVPDYSDKKTPGKLKPYVESQKESKRDATDSLTFKQFKNGNTLRCESIGAEGTRSLGKTFDVLFADEVQDMTELAINKTTKCLTHAQFGQFPGGVQVYFGTPRQKGTFFHRMWEQSDQRRYYLGCSNCKNLFLLYTPESNKWEEIWLYENIVKCPKCGEEQDKIEAIERGQWKPTVGKEDSKFVGFHFNQLFIPEFTKEIILKEKPDISPLNSEIIWNNEILGEFHSGKGMPITFEEIYNNCKDSNRAMSKSIPQGEKVTYLGVDWGGKPNIDGVKRGASFCCGVVLSVDTEERFVIEYAEKLKEVTLDYKIAFVERMFRLYSIRSAMGDIGFAEDLSSELKKIYGDKYKSVRNSSMVSGGVKYNRDELEVVLDKDRAIEEMFNLLRRGSIRFPWASYENIIWLVKQCCSMESKITERKNEPYTTYIKGKLQNDGLMALIYAHLAYKFDKTKGFKISQHIANKSLFPKPVLAYFPKRI